MSDYENDKFSEESGEASADALYNLKLSVDLRSVKNMKVAANAYVQFSLNLGSGQGSKQQFHQFKSDQPTAIGQGTSETKLESSFASYEFQANKAALGTILNRNELIVSLVQQDGNRKIGEAKVPLKMLEQGEHKRTMTSLIIVSDKYLELK